MPAVTVEDLVAFELEVKALFESKAIRAPVHLRSGNEAILVQIFKEVGQDDWCFFGWASHLECLLKGVPRETLLAAIIEGRSISMCFMEHRIVSSAIVGGICPMAVGVAAGIKRDGLPERVWCLSVETPTAVLWGDVRSEVAKHPSCRYYRYTNGYPHAGIGRLVF